MDDQGNATGAKQHLVPFYDDTLVTLEHAGIHYVAMRRVVENIGLDWKSQHVKLKGQSLKFGCGDIATPSAGGLQTMLCIPIGKLALWLTTINPNKVRADLRDKVERYQAESAIALHDYWTKGFATRDGSDQGVAALRHDMDRLMAAVTGLLVMHDDRRAAMDLVSVRQLLDEAKVPSKKRNAINRKIGRELQARALEMTGRGDSSPHRRCAHTGTWLYTRDFADRFMRDKGRAWIADHLAALTGQTVIPFPTKAKPVEAPATV